MVGLAHDVLTIPVSSIGSLKHQHDIYDSSGRIINAAPKINQPLPPVNNGKSSASTTVAEARPATIVIPFLQKRVKTTHPAPPKNSQGSQATASSTANVAPVRNGQPIMPMNAPKSVPKPPSQPPTPSPPPAAKPKSIVPQTKPKQKQMPIIVIKQKQRSGYYRVHEGSTSISNPMSSKIQSGSTEVVVKKRYVPDYYTPPKVVMPHPLIPGKDSLTNVVSLTIRSAPHPPHHYPKRKVKKQKLAKKVHKKLAPKKHKKLKPKKKHHAKPQHHVKPAVVFKPKKHHARKHKKQNTKYVYIESKRSATSSPLSATHSYTTLRRVPAQSVSKKLIVVRIPS